MNNWTIWLETALWFCRWFMMLWMHNQGGRSSVTTRCQIMWPVKCKIFGQCLVLCSCALDATMWSLKTTTHKNQDCELSQLEFHKYCFDWHHVPLHQGFACCRKIETMSLMMAGWWGVWSILVSLWLLYKVRLIVTWLTDQTVKLCSVCVDWTEGFWSFDYIVMIPVYPKDCHQWGHREWADPWWEGQMIICFIMMWHQQLSAINLRSSSWWSDVSSRCSVAHNSSWWSSYESCYGLQH